MLVLASLILVTDNSNEEVVLKKIPYIYYLIQFQKEQVIALFDNGSKVNTINSEFAQKLGLYIQKTGVEAQKIDGSILETFGLMIADF